MPGRSHYHPNRDDGIEFERKAFYLLFATQDAHEGMRAFIDRRQPTYEGR